MKLFFMGNNMNEKTIRLSLDISPELNGLLDEMARLTFSTKCKILQKAIALMEVAVQEKEKGNHLGVINKDHTIIKEIIGV